MKVESKEPVTTPSAGPEGEGGYREDQGRLVRMAAFWGCTLLLLFGCTFLHGVLVQNDSLQDPINGIRIPIVGVDLSGAFLISLGVFVVGLIAIARWQARPKTVDLLVDTEAELRKVTWPTMTEVVNSSFVVVITVLVLFGFLAAADWFLARVMKYLLLGAV